ncbi:MAG: hypothetical protein AABX54_01915 [Nanoarchaeota archaeon]
MEKLPENEIAECVGLWLAEGDRKTKSEITFTNNCVPLVELFYKVLCKLFEDKKDRIRIYVYSNNHEKIDVDFCSIVNYYNDKRARKPYCILRLASVEYLKEWKKIVENIINNEELYNYILRGFFAGEGNIKEGSHNSRGLRIAQKEKNTLVESILKNLKIKKFKFRSDERSYIIYGKINWDIFAELKLADLHPEKKKRFWRVYHEFKQDHYENNYLKDNIFLLLNKPLSARELMKRFNRSFARIQEILIDLKKQGKVKNFRVGSIDYWTNNPNLVIISKIKKEYLLYLTEPRRTSDFAKKFKVCSRSSFRRLNELNNLNLVERDKDKSWRKISINNEIMVI